MQIEAERARPALSVWDAVVGGQQLPLPADHADRAVSTVLGMIPIAPTVFWGPMAFAIMGGLLVATLLTLVFLPALYVTLFRARAPDRSHATARAPAGVVAE